MAATENASPSSLPVVQGEQNAGCGSKGGTSSGGCGGACHGCSKPKQSAAESEPGSESSRNEALLDAQENVLSTLHKSGSRRWIMPKLAQGLWWHRRRAVAYVLMVIFVIVPHLRMYGRPIIKLDILAREFTLLGHTFLPTDTLLVALLLLTALVGVVFATTAIGRAWCGWACPQTVYIEFLFRPLDRLFMGTIGRGGAPKDKLPPWKEAIRFVLYLGIISVLANSFLAYFVGTEQLAEWLWGSPLDHPIAFAVMATTTGLLMYDFFYFREQTCLIACPYGRFQSVMLDQQSLIVAYDPGRGEPRRKGKRAEDDSAGDCVDCNQCVVVCPTGIDIRDGLQMECINCTQCIDACDNVMQKVGRETGLIRYTSQAALSGAAWKFWRARTIAYPVILLLLASGFVLAAAGKYSFDARVIRGKGAPFVSLVPGQTTNSFSLRLVNRSDEPQQYQVTIMEPANAELEVVEPQLLELAVDESNLVPIQIHFPISTTAGDGNEKVFMQISDSSGHQKTIDFKLLGPR